MFLQNAAIGSNTEWMKACGASSVSKLMPWGMSALPLLQGGDAKQSFTTGMYGALFAALFMLAILAVSKFFKRSRRGHIALRTGNKLSFVNMMIGWLR